MIHCAARPVSRSAAAGFLLPAEPPPPDRWLDGEAILDQTAAVQDFYESFAGGAAILALGAELRRELQPSEAGTAFGARHIALFSEIRRTANAMRGAGPSPAPQLSFIAAADASAMACVRCADVLRPALLGRLSEQTDAPETASRREVSLGRPLEAPEKHLRLPAP